MERVTFAVFEKVARLWWWWLARMRPPASHLISLHPREQFQVKEVAASVVQSRWAVLPNPLDRLPLPVCWNFEDTLWTQVQEVKNVCLMMGLLVEPDQKQNVAICTNLLIYSSIFERSFSTIDCPINLAFMTSDTRYRNWIFLKLVPEKYQRFSQCKQWFSKILNRI